MFDQKRSDLLEKKTTESGLGRRTFLLRPSRGKAEIEIHEAEDLYKEIRIENVVTTEEGKKDKLKEGEDIDLIVEAEPKENKQKP